MGQDAEDALRRKSRGRAEGNTEADSTGGRSVRRTQRGRERRRLFPSRSTGQPGIIINRSGIVSLSVLISLVRRSPDRHPISAVSFDPLCPVVPHSKITPSNAHTLNQVCDITGSGQRYSTWCLRVPTVNSYYRSRLLDSWFPLDVTLYDDQVGPPHQAMRMSTHHHVTGIPEHVRAPTPVLIYHTHMSFSV